MVQLTSLLARPARRRKEVVTSVLVNFPVARRSMRSSVEDSVIRMTFGGRSLAGSGVTLRGRSVGGSGTEGFTRAMVSARWVCAALAMSCHAMSLVM